MKEKCTISKLAHSLFFFLYLYPFFFFLSPPLVLLLSIPYKMFRARELFTWNTIVYNITNAHEQAHTHIYRIYYARTQMFLFILAIILLLAC